jgi:hypothetical protein
MTRHSFRLGDAITGEPHLYTANPTTPPADPSGEPPASEPKQTSRFRRFVVWCTLALEHDGIVSVLEKTMRP